MSHHAIVSRKYVVQNLTPKFRESVKLVNVAIPEPAPTDIIVKNRFVGINATDINTTAGRYFVDRKTPFDIGYEGIGEVVAVGSKCRKFQVGHSVGYMYWSQGAFAEYTVIPEETAFRCPSQRPEYIALTLSGITAAICLDKTGEMKSGDTVMLTAAAGGTGQIAVQLAKNAGCHVIGTCSTEEKAAFLKRLGCDRVIIYTKENLGDVLQKEYPRGIDLIFECIGGDVYDTCVRNLAVHGTLIIIGFIAGYKSQEGYMLSKEADLSRQLLMKSARVQGFMLNHYNQYWSEYFRKLVTLVEESKLIITLDNGADHPKGPFKGIESIPDAVEYLYTRRSIGKIYVDLQESK